MKIGLNAYKNVRNDCLLLYYSNETAASQSDLIVNKAQGQGQRIRPL